MARWGPLDPGALRAFRALGDPRARPNRNWLRRLLKAPTGQVNGWLPEIAELEALETRLRFAHATGGRAFYAQFRAPFDLYVMARAIQPQHIVETGVSSGVSSAHFLAALRRNGHGILHSVDLPVTQRASALGASESVVSVPPGRWSGWAVPDELKAGWDLRIGRSQEQLPALIRELPAVDLFLHDSHHTPTHLTFELETIRPKLHPGAIVLADNTEWTGAAFDRFARSLGAPIARRGRSDLVGVRVPAPEMTGITSASARAGA